MRLTNKNISSINVAFSAKNSAFSASIFFILLLMASCAQVVPPGGGPIDKTPPKALKYIPDSASLNFKAKTILINFDEYILLRDLNTQLIISPPFEHIPDIAVKNKTLIIELDKKETLKPNTTYAINFGSALQDYNENNPLGNFKYIFSTGSFIDSMTVNGKVQNALDFKTEKGVLVMLYKNLNDSVVYKNKPDYFAKTNIDGTFQINNIKNGKYKLIALKDINANYIYDGETESIGFANAEIDVSKKEKILIDIFQEPAKKVHLKKYIHDQYGRITLIFSQGSDSIKVLPLNTSLPNDQVILDFSKNKDTLTYWIKKYEKDSLKLQVLNGSKILDTVEFKMIKKEDALKSRKNPLRLRLLNSPSGNQNFDLNSELKLLFNNPIVSAKKENFIQLKADSVLVPEYKHLDYFFDFSTVKIQLQDTVKPKESDEALIPAPAILNPKFKENTNYHLLILPGTFTDIFGLTNDSIKIDFKTKEEKFYGTVKLKITIPETKNNYIVQLLDEQEKVIDERSIKKSEELDYNYLYPKKYKLKLIYDANSNGKWDTGDYLKKIQPEKVIYNPEPMNIRSNWDLDLEWDITNYK